MRGVSAISALLTALLCVGCTDGGSPAGPSSFRGDNLTTNSAAGQGASMGASVSPIPSAARVPFRGTFEGSQTTTPLGPTQAFSVVSATGTATLLGPFTVEIPHTVDFAAPPTGENSRRLRAGVRIRHPCEAEWCCLSIKGGSRPFHSETRSVGVHLWPAGLALIDIRGLSLPRFRSPGPLAI